MPKVKTSKPKEEAQEKLPLVTIVIPNHNYQHWVEDAMMSVIEQDYPAKQLVVVDDGSTDGSWMAIARLMDMVEEARKPIKDRQQVKVMTNMVNGVPVYAAKIGRAGGPSAARNAGMKILWDNTHIFGFLDADDTYLPGKISKSVSEFLKDPSRIGAVYSDYITHHIDKDLEIREYKEPYDFNRLQRECIVNNDSLVSKGALSVVGMYDEEMRVCEDYDLWMRVGEQYMITHIPEALVKIRVSGHNSSTTVDKETWEANWRRVMMKAAVRNGATQ